MTLQRLRSATYLITRWRSCADYVRGTNVMRCLWIPVRRDERDGRDERIMANFLFVPPDFLGESDGYDWIVSYFIIIIIIIKKRDERDERTKKKERVVEKNYFEIFLFLNFLF